MKVKYDKDYNYKNGCIKLLNEITDDWILWQIYRVIVNITKEE